MSGLPATVGRFKEAVEAAFKFGDDGYLVSDKEHANKARLLLVDFSVFLRMFSPNIDDSVIRTIVSDLSQDNVPTRRSAMVRAYGVTYAARSSVYSRSM